MSATSATAARWQATGASRMSPPVLFVIDDDTGVMRALRDDLSRQFGGDFRVIGESWPAAGLAALRRLARSRVAELIDFQSTGVARTYLHRVADVALTELAALRRLADGHEPVALLIVDHDMTGMSGVDFLARAHEMHPLAKRVLLVERDYSARSPIVQAMTLGQADYHLTKPWTLEHDLYREISGFLADWATDQQAGFELSMSDYLIRERRPRTSRFACTPRSPKVTDPPSSSRSPCATRRRAGPSRSRRSRCSC